MSFLDLAQTRYATKRYNPAKPIPPGKIEELKQILRLTPSSINCQPWKFTFVQDPELKAKLAAVSMYNEHKIQDAPLLIVFQVVQDLEVFEDFARNEWEERMAEMFFQAREALSEAQIQGWFTHQVYIALGFCLAACASLELDATPMEGIEKEKYAELLGCTSHHPVLAVCVGYRADDDFNDPAHQPKIRRALEVVVESR